MDDFGASEEGAAQLVDHTDVADLLPLLFGSGSEGGYGTAQRPWLARLACRLVFQLPRYCRTGPAGGPGAAGIAAGQQDGSALAAAADAESLDFSKWLLSTAQQEDTVVLALDLPTQQQVRTRMPVLLPVAAFSKLLHLHWSAACGELSPVCLLFLLLLLSHCCCLCVCVVQLDILRSLLLDETLLLVDHLLVRHHPLVAASCSC